MNSIPATQARQNFAKTIADCRDEPVVITDHGREVAVMMSPELAQLALAVLEDSHWLEEALKAKGAAGKNQTLEEVAKELGIELEQL
jgi:prevent-host-death family protein